MHLLGKPPSHFSLPFYGGSGERLFSLKLTPRPLLSRTEVCSPYFPSFFSISKSLCILHLLCQFQICPVLLSSEKKLPLLDLAIPLPTTSHDLLPESVYSWIFMIYLPSPQPHPSSKTFSFKTSDALGLGLSQSKSV